MDVVRLDEIIVEDRARKDMGDIDSMVASIKEFGVIQPIVLTKREDGRPRLMVGGRRLAALKKMGNPVIEHAEHFVWREELDPIRLRSMELEENLKRKDMEWPEVIAAKAELLKLMESIHGVQKVGGVSISERNKGQTDGFGVRKLASMLGESPATTSQDLQLAKMVKAIPQLSKVDTKSAAMRTGMLQVVVGAIKQKAADDAKTHADAVAAGTAVARPVPKNWHLYEGDFRDNINLITSSSVDLVNTDLPYGVDIDNNSMQGITFEDARKTIIDLLPTIASESYRILRDGRYAVYFFGFNFYGELKDALTKVGFKVNPIPTVWVKHRNYSPNPLRWYTSGYEQALVCCKGDAKLIRLGSNDIIDIPNVPPSDKMQVAQKPVELIEKFILDMTLPFGTVVDMFAGTGTAGVAALKNGRKAILFEKDKNQCHLIRNRLSTEVKS